MKWLIGIITLGTIIYVSNASWFRATPVGDLQIVSHRGVHQTYSKENLSSDGCTATRIDEPQHEYLENTIDSIRAAFSYGADIVEIDIHPTSDGRFAIFHDWTLDCRTNGSGITREHSLSYLQSLDIGYGYTADQGKSFPFRGAGVGEMPSLKEVLDAFPDRRFLVNIKSNSEYEADLINLFLDERSGNDIARLSFYGGGVPTARLLSLRPELKGFSRNSVKKCVIDYLLKAWTGYVPKSCRRTMLAIPKNYAKYLWGWPNLFLSRMEAVDTDVILVNLSHGHTDGIDDPNYISDIANTYRGLIWTDKIEKLNLND